MSSDDQKVTIFIDVPIQNTTYSFVMDNTTTILNLKQKLSLVSKIPSSRLCIQYAGHIYNNRDILKYILKDNLKLFRVTII
jgi:hypothetical protein